MNKATWILVGAAAALAAAAPASAQSVGLSGGSGRHFGGPGGAHLGGPHFGTARNRCARLGRDCFGRGFARGRGLLGWGGGLLEDPDYAARDAGFFSGPAQVLASNGGAYYDYDRSYPYDWYSEPADAAREAPAMAAPEVRCDVSWVTGRGGERSAVRVCRGR
jgi:hypothetical protein